MRIAIEASWALGEPTGIGYYVRGLLKGLAAVAPGNDYFLLHWSRSWTEPLPGENFHPVSYWCGKAALAMRYRLPRVLSEIKADVFHASNSVGLGASLPCPGVCMVHDLIWFQAPDSGPWLNGWIFRRQFRNSVRHAKAFICNSGETARELCQWFPEVEGRPVVVSHLAPDPFQRVAGARPKHLLCLGGLERRKNQDFLLLTYKELLRLRPDAPPLVLAGPDRGGEAKLRRMVADLGLAEKVDMPGYVDARRKRELYSEAFLTLMPSSQEGFGIPLLEAMQCGVPVLASDIPIFREVGGTACLLVEGWEPSLWARAIAGMLDDTDSYSRYAKGGLDWAGQFTWEACARKTLECYDTICRKPDI